MRVNPRFDEEFELDSSKFSKGCDSLKNNTKCPLKSGEFVTYKSDYTIDLVDDLENDDYHRIYFKFYLLNEKDRVVVCIDKVPIIIKKPKSFIANFFSNFFG